MNWKLEDIRTVLLITVSVMGLMWLVIKPLAERFIYDVVTHKDFGLKETVKDLRKDIKDNDNDIRNINKRIIVIETQLNDRSK